ncbi:MAG: YlxR family protein [Candidatus Electrothrix sp. AW2]|nr:YlxR family protein [Candidatus Electrothrix sp. AX1]MCI5116711.1 YlxR family protein [Candidatus Electrothrix gigas]MCI5127847.1 YlxR family protein [Candidatus Electrothrix gigas]MCI5134609.1 YlxR family protein [Candidatus Electrothrix gigas]MCI5178359.1 YlxR family protein [Candidatus Electrothrix gigas]
MSSLSHRKQLKKKEHVPIRTCKGCGRKAKKSELIRLVWREGGLQEDLDGRMSGRGVYICNREQCRNRLVKNKKMLRRAFRLHG